MIPLVPQAALAVAVRALAARPDAIALVDGRSGSGKTTFAAALARASGARLLRLDDVYPGWDGLAAAAAALVRDGLLPRRAGVAGRLRRWDWVASRQGDALVLPPPGRLVLEGCGSLSRAAARLADLGVWVELDAPERRRRALARDGDSFAPHWSRWARQEDAFIAREDPRGNAGLAVDGRRFTGSVFSGRSERTPYRCAT